MHLLFSFYLKIINSTLKYETPANLAAIFFKIK